MNNEEKIAQDIYTISDLIGKGEYKTALNSFQKLEAKYPENISIKYNKVSVLIETGSGLKESELIREGVTTGEIFLEDPSFDGLKPKLHYNIANGYIDLYKLERPGYKSIKEFVDNKNLQNAKYYYRKTLEDIEYIDLKSKIQLWTNYGNCLDSLGRHMEAMYVYDEVLNTDPDFAMALANKALSIKFFADISGVYRKEMYILSHQMLKSALKKNSLIEFGGISAKRFFELQTQLIERMFRDKALLNKNIQHPKYDTVRMSQFEKYYLNFCVRHKLFLNFHIHQKECKASILDSVFISIITPINDTVTFYKLAKQINQIKEDYVVARLLLAQSQFENVDLNNISNRTAFVDSLDYSIFNIYIGLLKSAFKEAYDILDKIARFINEYYQLGFNGDIYFSTIWQCKNNKNEWRINPKILDSENLSLYALYDIFLDFKSHYYNRIRKIRNASVHERLVIYDSELTDWDKKTDKYNIGYKTMVSQTIRLLQLVKSCIIYMINFVQLEENKKRKKLNGLIGQMYVDAIQHL